MAMLRALVELGAGPVVLHVEHGVRGEESLGDARFVRDLCGRLGLGFELRHLRLEGQANFQERARLARYRLAEQVSDERGIRSVATGHTADDVAETVLINLARGAGLRGLSGIPPVRGRFVRPLIEHTREEVLAYLAYLGQPYRTDPTNLTVKYARNRIRQEVLPVLEDLYPGAGRNIARGAGLLREDLAALEGLAERAIRRRGKEVVVPSGGLEAMPEALRRYVVRLAYSAALPGARGLDSAAVGRVLGLLRRKAGTRVLNLPGGVVAAGRADGELAFYPGGEAGEGEADVCDVRAGSFAFGGREVEVREAVRFDAGDAARPEVAYLDAEKGPYRVRMAREGDIIRPLGLGGTKKVFKAMVDRGVPGDLRRRTPVVVDERGRVAWVFGGEIGEEFKVGEASEKILRLEVGGVREHG